MVLECELLSHCTGETVEGCIYGRLYWHDFARGGAAAQTPLSTPTFPRLGPSRRGLGAIRRPGNNQLQHPWMYF